MPVVTVTAPAQDLRYEIHIGRRLLGSCAPLLAPYAGRKAAVVADSITAPLYAGMLMEQLTLAGMQPALVTIPAGEASKCPDQLSALYDAFLDMRLTRSDVVFALGGGVVGDIAGYAACTYESQFLNPQEERIYENRTIKKQSVVTAYLFYLGGGICGPECGR